MMRKSTAEKIVKRLQDFGYKASIYEGYSGRAMYGRTVIGISTNAHPSAFRGIIKRSMKVDNLGLGYIYY